MTDLAAAATAAAAAAAAGAAAAAAAILPPTEVALIPDAFGPGCTPLVSDAKAIITAMYPRLCGRFNLAFSNYADTDPLRQALDAIVADVRAWIVALPESCKANNHTIARPKHGLSFVLKHAATRSAFGEAYCAMALHAFDRVWEDCKRELIAPSVPKANREGGSDGAADAEADSTVEDLDLEIEELKTTNHFLASNLVDLIALHYDTKIASLVNSLLRGIRPPGQPQSRVPPTSSDADAHDDV